MHFKSRAIRTMWLFDKQWCFSYHTRTICRNIHSCMYMWYMLYKFRLRYWLQVFTKHIHRKLITNSSQKIKSGTYYIITNSIWLFVLVINAKRKFLHLEQATALWSVVNCSRLIVLHKMIVTACDKLFYIFNLRASMNKNKIFKQCFISWFKLSWKVNKITAVNTPTTCT